MTDILQELKGSRFERIKFEMIPRAIEEIERLRAELKTARAYARHERDLGAEEVAQANASLIQTLQDDLAEAVDAIQPFAKAHQDVLRALVYPNWQWELPTTDDYETAQAIVEKHKWRSTLQKLETT